MSQQASDDDNDAQHHGEMNNTILTQLSTVLIQDQDPTDNDKVSFKFKDVPLGKLPRAEKPKTKCNLTQ